MLTTRTARALYAVLVTAVLAAPAPSVCSAASSTESAPGHSAPSAERLAPAPGPTGPIRARIPGVRGLEVAVPAYVWANDQMLNELTATGPAASVVVLNPGNGDAPFGAPWQARADVLRGGTTTNGERTKVLGYVHTDHGNRPPAEVRASVDNYLKTADGRLHVDGIFFDVVSRDCGPANATRDLYAGYHRYVEEAMQAVDPDAPDLVVDNPGTAIADCYLEPGHRTADIFVTYEDTYAAYTGGGWLGGNVFNETTGYRPGTELDPSGTAFWHLIHDVPSATAMRAALQTAFTRGAGYAYATSTAMPNPWNATPAWAFGPQTSYAAALG
ncbi:spherulation-specific family 4 protein [Streptomyces sp. G-G2]|uniref:spherulation-specific family 4 protein n=1 Tax=Streptomyces sp. G-G2 TaxID=3046201 RepID=UPI0024BA26D3|nr:spherulation-specific family 4 protein [Streptomyces sp. G-G2]MDJ0381193.1 spherulation-specific family 4 protein [Streptomyces sp. G-G2]